MYILSSHVYTVFVITAESSRKRKSEQSPEEPVKKPLLNAKEFSFGREVRSTHCSEKIVKGAVTVHNGKVYFASGKSIHVLNATHKKPHWLPKIELNRTNFGLTTINDNMLLAVGGKVDGGVVSSVMCYAVNNSSTQSTWEEKYPNMAAARFDPEVVHYNNYVIVIAGWTKDHYFQESRAELSVEILSLKEEQWHLIESMKLPNYLNPMSCMSACVCNDTLYLTAKHRDADYYHNSPPEKNYDEEEIADPYQCFSFFQCIINDFTQMDSFMWHPLNHPHDVTFSVSDTAITYGNDCRFSLLCIGDNLFAIGCDHIEAIAPDSLQESLKRFYEMFAAIDSLAIFSVQGSRRIMGPEPHCAIHLYDPDMDTWKKIHMIDDFGLTLAQPLVAVIDDRLVIVRSTTNACLLHLMNN